MFFFEVKIDIPTIWDKGTPSFRNEIAEMCYLYRRTGGEEKGDTWSSFF